MTASTLRAGEPIGDASLDRLSDLAERLGHQAEAAVDRVRGRPRRPGPSWLLRAGLLVVLAVVAGVMAMTWVRTRGSTSRADALEALEGLDRMSEPGSLGGPDLGAAADLPPARGAVTGLTAAEDSLLSYDPIEGRDA